MDRPAIGPAWKLVAAALAAMVFGGPSAAAAAQPLLGVPTSLPGGAVLVALVAAVVTFCVTMEARLRRLWRLSVKSHAEALHRARIDTVTGLADRRAFDTALAASLPGTSLTGPSLTGPPLTGVLLLDLDGFRALRNAHGRQRADLLLREFARRLAGAAPLGSVVARIHGDEFGIVTPLRNQPALDALCESLLREMLLPYYPDGSPCQMSLSIGAASLPEHGGPEAAANAAHTALQQAKASGGRTWRRYDTAMAAAASRNSELRAELPAALAAGQFVPHYQPIVRLVTGEIHGFEVLARWQHPKHGLLLPADFIGLAEEQYLCGQLSLSLLRQVISDSRDWPARWRFAFNTSPGQLRELIDFVHDPAQVPRHMMDPRRIELEITENALITDMALARTVVDQMHRNGTRVVLDDFGTGYANFRHLRELDVDGIKIDKSFVQDMMGDSRSEACVRAILALGQSLDVSVTAEGVESAETARRLQDMGCQFAQGYLFSSPVPAGGMASFASKIRLVPGSV